MDKMPYRDGLQQVPFQAGGKHGARVVGVKAHVNS